MRFLIFLETTQINKYVCLLDYINAQIVSLATTHPPITNTQIQFAIVPRGFQGQSMKGGYFRTSQVPNCQQAMTISVV